MEETYTFSRALHMMRYDGKIMRPLVYSDKYYFRCDLTHIYGCGINGEEVILNGDVIGEWLESEQIMSSWVEVKD